MRTKVIYTFTRTRHVVVHLARIYALQDAASVTTCCDNYYYYCDGRRPGICGRGAGPLTILCVIHTRHLNAYTHILVHTIKMNKQCHH